MAMLALKGGFDIGEKGLRERESRLTDMRAVFRRTPEIYLRLRVSTKPLFLEKPMLVPVRIVVQDRLKRHLLPAPEPGVRVAGHVRLLQPPVLALWEVFRHHAHPELEPLLHVEH